MSTPESMTAPDKSLISKIISLTAAGLGTGWIPFMPGTWGSLLGVALTFFTGASVYVVVFMSVFAWVIIHLDEGKSGLHDHSSTTLDEIAAMSWCYFALPWTLPIIVAGFLVFRFFDIVKPWPISWADEKVPGAFGTLLDDLMAGAATCLVLHLILYFAPDVATIF